MTLPGPRRSGQRFRALMRSAGRWPCGSYGRTWATRRPTALAARLTLKPGWRESRSHSRKGHLILTGDGSTGG